MDNWTYERKKYVVSRPIVSSDVDYMITLLEEHGIECGSEFKDSHYEVYVYSKGDKDLAKNLI